MFVFKVILQQSFALPQIAAEARLEGLQQHYVRIRAYFPFVCCSPTVRLCGRMIGRPECEAPHQSRRCPRDIAPPGLLNIGMWRDWGLGEGSFRLLLYVPGTVSNPDSANLEDESDLGRNIIRAS